MTRLRQILRAIMAWLTAPARCPGCNQPIEQITPGCRDCEDRSEGQVW